MSVQKSVMVYTKAIFLDMIMTEITFDRVRHANLTGKDARRLAKYLLQASSINFTGFDLHPAVGQSKP